MSRLLNSDDRPSWKRAPLADNEKSHSWLLSFSESRRMVLQAQRSLWCTAASHAQLCWFAARMLAIARLEIVRGRARVALAQNCNRAMQDDEASQAIFNCRTSRSSRQP